MKSLKTIFIAAIAVFAFACNQKTINYTLISGTLENYTNDEIAVFDYDFSKIKIAVSEDGTFADTIRKEGELILSIGKEFTRIYAVNGANLIISADANDFSKSVKVSGEKSGMSNYLIYKSKLQPQSREEIIAKYSVEEAEFWANAKEFLAKLEAELEKVDDISDELRDLEKRAVKAIYVMSLGTYCKYHGSYTQTEDFEASEELQNAASDIDFNDGELYEYSVGYRNLLRNESNSKAQKLVESGEASSIAIGNLMVAEEMENETIRENMLFNAVASSFTRVDDAKGLLDRYMALAKDEEKRAEVTEKYKAVAGLAAGQPSPKFNNFENYAGGTSSLNDFKGKYVYIDVWATWCGPCKAEIPHLKTVEEKYRGKNIVFVSISVDKKKDYETWRSMIAEKEMGGVQLITHESDFMDAYAIKGIPRFILIDPEGNIVNKNAPRPSTPQLIELFNELEI